MTVTLKCPSCGHISAAGPARCALCGSALRGCERIDTETDDKTIGPVSWGCAVLGAVGIAGFLALRVSAGFSLSPRYALGFDDGGPFYWAGAVVIIPATTIGAVLAWRFKQRGPMIANLVVLGAFLGYGLGS